MSCCAELPGFCLAVLLPAFQPLAAQTTTPRDGEPVSTLSAGSRSPVAFLPAPFHPGDTAFRADTERVGHHGSKSLHESIGMVIGAAAGYGLGKAVNGGTSGCGDGGSGGGCDWFSGLNEVVGAAPFGVVGLVIGAHLPHD